MRKDAFLLLFTAILLWSCQTEKKRPKDPEFALNQTEEIPVVTSDTSDDKGAAIWGYRFVLVGDFDGNQQQDTLVEAFVDSTGKETNKFFENLELLDYQLYTKIWKTKSYMYCSNATIDTFRATSHLGVEYAEVIGDIDGNGTDEIGIVPYHADMSSMNVYSIYTYKEGKWMEFYSFGIRDWRFPVLPGYNPLYGLFGTMEHINTTGQDSLNKHLLDKLAGYQCVELLENKCIQFEGLGYTNCEVIHELHQFRNNELWLRPKDYQYKENEKLVTFIYEDWEEEELDDIRQNGIDICDPATSFVFRVYF